MQRRGALRNHHPLLSYGRLTQRFLIHQAWQVFFNEEEHQRRLQNTPEFRRTVRSAFVEHHRRQLLRHHADQPNAEQQKIGRVYTMQRAASRRRTST
jgi:hypothetical protein